MANSDNLLTRSIASVKTKAPLWVTLLLLVGGFIFVASIGISQFGGYADRRADGWLKYARHLEAPAVEPSLQHSDDVTVALKSRIEAQLTDVRGAAHYHLSVARDFSTFQYLHITMATIAAVIAGVLLVPISWTGWKDAGVVLTTAFLLTAATAILFSSFSQLYRQQENIDDNISLYLAYLTLEDEILSYYPVREGDADQVVEPHKFVQRVDKRIAELRSLAVAFDPTKTLKFGDVFDELSSPLGDQADTTP